MTEKTAFPFPFRTPQGRPVPAVTAAQMRQVDDLAAERFRLALLQMMENAGRHLAAQAQEMLGPRPGSVVVLAGPGGNGGGGLCAARHLHNRGIPVQVALIAPKRLSPAAARQAHILREAGVPFLRAADLPQALNAAGLTLDALLGYSLRGAPRPPYDAWIAQANAAPASILSLDLPSGLDATTGETPGAVIHPTVTLTLALPKTGLRHAPGDLVLADIGIPLELYRHLGLEVGPLFAEGDHIPLVRV